MKAWERHDSCNEPVRHDHVSVWSCPRRAKAKPFPDEDGHARRGAILVRELRRVAQALPPVAASPALEIVEALASSLELLHQDYLRRCGSKPLFGLRDPGAIERIDHELELSRDRFLRGRLLEGNEAARISSPAVFTDFTLDAHRRWLKHAL